MEHLALPRDPIRPHPEIGLATAQFTDKEDFLGYPERHCSLLIGNHPHVPTQADALAGRFTASVSSYDILNYFQGWLFFALLSDFLGPLYKHSRYLDVVMKEGDEGGIDKILLSTKNLYEDLAIWRQQGPLSQIKEGDEYHQHLQECLDNVAGAFDAIRSRYPGFVEVFSDEMLCIASLAEALDSAINTAIEHGPVDEMLHRGFPAQASRRWLQKVYSILDTDGDEVRSRMIGAGWCPGDISRMDDVFNTIAGYYYFTNFKPDAQHPDLHKDCPSYGCTLSSLAEPRHMSPDCNCPGMIKFTESSLEEIYEVGDIPCFSIGRLEDGGLGVALSSISIDAESQKDPDNRYVALSHVWSEGMGNPFSNELPLCQLAYVYHWAMCSVQLGEHDDEWVVEKHDPYSTGIKIESKPKVQQINLWVDTMCCPATPGYGKNLCLARMREIYENAYTVLVRSAALESMALKPYLQQKELGIMDVAAQFWLSPWMRRMWTLQEGVLAGMSRSRRGVGDRLVLLFDDGLLSLESIVGMLKQAPPHESALAFDMINKFSELAPFMYKFDGGVDPDQQWGFNAFLIVLSRALKYRSVSVASDELLCLATLLGLRIKEDRSPVPLVGDGERPEDGMCELWRRMEQINQGIPGDIIFSSIPRIDMDGFRWAPRTIVQHAKWGSLAISESSTLKPAKITPLGLRVCFPGVRLSIVDDDDDSEIISRVGNLTVSDIDGQKGVDGEKGGDGKNDADDKVDDPSSRVLLVEIPTGSGEWYSVDLFELPERAKSTEKEALHVRDKIRKGNMALLLSKPASHKCRALLVTVEDGDEDDGQSPSPICARTESLAFLHRLSPGAALISPAIIEYRKRLRATAVENTDSGLQEQIVAELFTESEELKVSLYMEALSKSASATEEDIIKRFITYVGIFEKGGGVYGALMPEDQLWFVD
ncbi:hypothetical protein QBC35DRAFT_510026 [Podospora australis]|uniref:Heterokaryon incompatibility domain-containing protein n=1 Tax=Podospora australis TaxID=1536484 RepID=A0AAN6WIE3_9PEZI|nr:hypothetical protein QBC35DRAFT_510026 [Podospora australis]